MTYAPGKMDELGLEDGHKITVDFISGEVRNLNNDKTVKIQPFYDAQMQIYKNNGLL